MEVYVFGYLPSCVLTSPKKTNNKTTQFNHDNFYFKLTKKIVGQKYHLTKKNFTKFFLPKFCED